MYNFISKRRNKKGFTLIELIIVVAILAILAGVLIPVVGGQINESKQKAANSDAATIVNVLNEMLALQMLDVGNAFGGNGKIYLMGSEIKFLKLKLPTIALGDADETINNSQLITTITNVNFVVGNSGTVVVGLKYNNGDAVGVYGEPL